MSTIKDKMTEIIQAQPMRELAFERMVARGLEDVRQNRLISDEEMEKRIGTWQK
ncbi:MAG: hypothetical protein KKE76_11605 [Gammaproteobacteria bacterium]|nr:hypothetical protein [Gammaproteobacteria bacterium]